MNLLIKSATIVDPKSDFHNQAKDILIEKGLITQIADALENPKNYRVILRPNLHISQGWFDSSVSFGQPGFEERETIANGLKTAALSGFTHVAVNANTQPVRDSGSEISFLNDRAQKYVTETLPIGALTKNMNGTDLAELYDMHQAGAVAFYDYQHATENANLMKLALQYASTFGGLVCSFPQHNQISGHGVANEGESSTKLGLKGLPNLAEQLQIARDLHLLEYTGGKLHIPTISTAQSVDLIRAAKAKKLDVSCSVAIHNLFFTDEMLAEFDTRYKVLPPLRTQSDINALKEGLRDGTIDMVTTDHNPLNIELKKMEFDHAAFGCTGLESAFGALNTLFTTKKAIELLTKGKARFGVPSTPLNIGSPADVALFDPTGNYTFTKNDIRSKSKNSIFLGAGLKGRVYGVIKSGKTELN